MPLGLKSGLPTNPKKKKKYESKPTTMKEVAAGQNYSIFILKDLIEKLKKEKEKKLKEAGK